MSKGKLTSVMRAAGGIEGLIDPAAKEQDAVALITYLAESQKFDKLLENQQVLREAHRAQRARGDRGLRPRCLVSLGVGSPPPSTAVGSCARWPRGTLKAHRSTRKLFLFQLGPAPLGVQ